MPIQHFNETEAAEICGFLRRRDPHLEILFGQRLSRAEALRKYALALWTEGNPQAAAKILNLAASLAPQDMDIWQDFAGALFADRQFADACEAVEVVLDKNHNPAANYLLLAMSTSQLGQDEEAEAAYLKVLALEPGKPEASFGLGLIYAKSRRYNEAAGHLSTAVKSGFASKEIYIALGQCFYLQGEFEAAHDAFSKSHALDPDQPPVIEKLAVLELILDAIKGEADPANIRKISPTFTDLAGATRTAFHLLSGYGYYDAAKRLGTLRLRLAPDDKTQTYLNAALEGEALARAPDDYLVAFFDGFADTFERQLVEVLGYRTPQEIAARLAATKRAFRRIADLGCGTGLAGPLLKTPDNHLTGVDLSPKMLAQAAAKQSYDAQSYDVLVEAEAVQFLAATQEPFNLVIAADTLIYIGDLEPLFAALPAALAPEGIFAFSIETCDGDYKLLPSGRFAHGEAYIERLAAPHFTLLEKTPTTIRLEANVRVDGAIILLQRK